MFNIMKILHICLMNLFSIIVNPIYWMLMLLLYFQYGRLGKMEKKVLGVNKVSIHKRVFTSAIMGLLGGIIGSIIVILLGITIEVNDFKYIFILAILLMLINSRFICFSYGGGILSLTSLIFGYPKIDVSSIMAVVAILHLIESFLIFVDGYKSKVPIFIERGNRIIGGFNLMRFWPLPFIVLMVSTQGGLHSTDWWPIFKSGELLEANNLYYVMAGVMAVLGYGDVALTDYPKNKAKSSSKNLFIFSIILLILAVISSHVYLFKYLAALFSPIAHEWLIQKGKKKEMKGKPIFVPSRTGVKILDVIPKGKGSKLGLKTGDIILAVNGQRVDSKEEINHILSDYPTYIWVDYYNIKGKTVTKDVKDYRRGIRSLGILVVPKYSQYSFIIKEMDGLGIRLMKWIKKIILGTRN